LKAKLSKGSVCSARNEYELDTMVLCVKERPLFPAEMAHMKALIMRAMRILCVLGALSPCLASPLVYAATQGVGPVSGLPMPRFVSLKSDRVNLREGPSKDHRTAWVFQRAGLPVEITAEYDKWRRIRDSEGAEGWVLQSLLSGRRTALVAPWKKIDSLPLRSQANANADISARLQPGVLGNVRKCDGTWCRIFGDGFDGYIEQSNLWGVYPDEKYEP
jgi:SH3-like domain-containing protein